MSWRELVGAWYKMTKTDTFKLDSVTYYPEVTWIMEKLKN